MPELLGPAQLLVQSLLALMPTVYQRDSLQALLGLFLQANGRPLPQHCQLKSASALSRFLNRYNWPTRQLIRLMRQQMVNHLLAQRPRGRRPHLQVIVDLTTLSKRGKFKALEGLTRVFHRKRGLHLVVLYVVVGPWRLPWSWRIYRGKGTLTPAQLAIRMIHTLPKRLRQHYKLTVLADCAFGNIEFLKAMRRLKVYVVVGIPCSRTLQDGRQLRQLTRRGQQVYLAGLSFPLYVTWHWLKREDGKSIKRFVLSTRRIKSATILWWGRRRWQIEGWFKTAKHRFGLHCFGQQTYKGIYRWLVLCMVAFVLAVWGHLLRNSSSVPDWGAAAETAIQLLLPQVALAVLFQELERLRPLAQFHGIDLQFSRCKM